MPKLTLKEAKERFKKYGATMLDDVYINNATKYKLQCKYGHITYATLHDYERHGCTECNKLRKRRIAYDELKNAMEKEGYTLISPFEEFKTKKTKMTYKCGEDHIGSVSYEKFIGSKRRCAICANNQAYEFNFVKQYIENEGYVLVSTEYKNTHTPLVIICPKGHEFQTTFHSFKNNGVRCYCARESKGEKRIREYFIDKSIEFISQQKFENCRNVRPLPFDFYLPKYNLCVEYDGQQHFDEIHAYSKESFQQTKINDEIKTNYCKENNIPLLRIPYWEFNNIEKILENTLASIIKNFND